MIWAVDKNQLVRQGDDTESSEGGNCDILCHYIRKN